MNKVNAGFFNSYLSDIAFPPWFYIYIRGLNREDSHKPSIPVFGQWFGLSPWRAGSSIFLVGLISELMLLFWPQNLTSGTFDSYDILCYAFGIMASLIADLRLNTKDQNRQQL